jgi:nucleotide-binding universal stress UspA family protein
MIRTVLVPTDFSADADLVLRFAAGLGVLGVRRVVCGHVIDVTGLEGPVIAAKVDSTRALMRSKIKPLVDAGLDVEVRIPTGAPERELLALAMETHVDAIVCGTTGKSVADRLFVGSISERLARDSGVPALTVRFDVLRNAADPGLMARDFGRMVLVPTDFSPTAARAIIFAIGLPPKAVSRVRVFNVLPVEPDDAKRGKLEIGADAHLRSLVEMAKEKGLPATPVIGHGDATRAILAEIDESRATGVIIGSRGRNPLQEALMGSVSMALMRQASCPVLIVP